MNCKHQIEDGWAIAVAGLPDYRCIFCRLDELEAEVKTAERRGEQAAFEMAADECDNAEEGAAEACDINACIAHASDAARIRELAKERAQ